jgi:ABC-type multidrug transport system fused ATPase/permease subunit
MLCCAALCCTAQVGAGKRVFQLMARTPQLPPSGTQKPGGSPAGAALDFQSVSFAYPSRPTSWVLKDFDLQVSSQGLVDRSGFVLWGFRQLWGQAACIRAAQPGWRTL